MSDALTLAIDVGCTTTRLAIWDGRELSRIARYETPTQRTDWAIGCCAEDIRATWLTKLAEAAWEVASDDRPPRLVAISFAGVVSTNGDIFRSNSIWGNAAADLPLATVEAVFGLPVIVANDLHAATYRYVSGPIGPDEKILVLSVSSGIGSKTFVGRAGGVVMERQGRNGEIGLAVVEEGDRAITNNNGRLRGVVGNYASGIGFTRVLQRRAREAHDGPPFATSLLAKLIGSCDVESLEMDRAALNLLAVEALRKQDGFTQAAFRESVAMLAKVLHTVILYDAPTKIVICGGFAASLGEIYRDCMVSALQERFTFLYEADEINRMIEMGSDDDLDCLLGACRLAEVELGVLGNLTRVMASD